MSEVIMSGPLYKVQMTEYERGWGQRDMGTKYFTTEQEAIDFCNEYNKEPGDPDYFFRASYSRVD